MKSTLLLLLLSPFSVSAQSGLYQIQGKIGENTGHETIYLLHSSGGETIVDSCALAKGAFSFSGKVDSPELAHLSLIPPGVHQKVIFSPTQLLLYLEPGVIKVYSPDSLQHTTVTGNALSEDYQALRDGMLPFDDQLYALQNEFFALTDSVEMQAFHKAKGPRVASLMQNKAQVTREFVEAHPRSLVSLNVLQSLAGPMGDMPGVDSLFHLLSPELQNTPQGQKMAAFLTGIKRTRIGNPAPDFTQNDTADKAVSLHDFRGKYVLVDFWASWCGPCRAENPNVVKAYNAYKSKGFTVLSVSLDRPNARQAWLNAIRKDGMSWTNVSDLRYFDNEAARLYSIQAIPQNFLIDPDGKIIAKNLRGSALDKKLSEVFGM